MKISGRDPRPVTIDSEVPAVDIEIDTLSVFTGGSGADFRPGGDDTGGP